MRIGILLLLLSCFYAKLFAQEHCDLPERPNILLIIIDDNDPRFYNNLGFAAAYTPVFDSLMNNGTVFLNGYSTMGVCRPALATLLNGQYPDENQITNNLVTIELENTDAMPLLLKEAGYRTFVGGKFWEKRNGEYDTEYFGFTDKEKVHETEKFVRDGQDACLEFIASCSNSGIPWFVQYAPLLPHLPTDCPQEFVDQIDENLIEVPSWIAASNRSAFINDTRLYLGNLAWLDFEVGKVLYQIEELGQTSNTAVIILADNGWGYGVISKQSPYEYGVKTPISIIWPDYIPVQHREDLASFVDIPPTILDLAGVQIPSSYSGMSLVPCIFSNENARDYLFGKSWSLYKYPDDSLPGENTLISLWGRDSRYKYLYFYQDVNIIMDNYLRWGHFYIVHPTISAGEEQLFDLWTDPFERNSLASNPAYQSILADLRIRSLNWSNR